MVALSPPGLPGVVVDVPEGSETKYLVQGWVPLDAGPVTRGVVESDVEPPPRAGRGASAKAWRGYAHSVGVVVADDASREDVIAACVSADVPT